MADLTLCCKVGNQPYATGKHMLTELDGFPLSYWGGSVGYDPLLSDNMKKTFCILRVSAQYENLIKDIMSANTNFDFASGRIPDDAYRTKKKAIDLALLERIVGISGLESSLRSTGVTPVIDATGIDINTLLKDPGTIDPLAVDINVITSGDHTIGNSGQNFATGALYSGDVGTLTGNIKGTWETVTTETAIIRTNTNLTSFIATLDSNTPPDGDPTGGLIISINHASDGIRLTDQGPGTYLVENIYLKRTMASGTNARLINTSASATGYTFKFRDSLVDENNLAGRGVGLFEGNNIEQIFNIKVFRSTSRAFTISASNVASRLENCTIIDNSNTGINFGSQTKTVKNITFVNVTTNIASGSNATTVNCGTDKASVGAGTDTNPQVNVTPGDEYVSQSEASSDFCKLKPDGVFDTNGTTPDITDNDHGERQNVRPHTGSVFSMGADELSIVTVRTWGDGSGPQTSDWNDASNWTGDAVPGVNEIARFDATDTTNCTLDVNALVGELDIQAGYSGTFDANRFDVTADDSGTQNGNITLAGSGTTDMDTGTWNVDGDFSFAGIGTLTTATSIINLIGTAKSFVHKQGFTMTNTINVTGSYTHSVSPLGGSKFSGVMTVSGTLSLSGATLREFTSTGADLKVTGAGLISGDGNIDLRAGADLSQNDGEIAVVIRCAATGVVDSGLYSDDFTFLGADPGTTTITPKSGTFDIRGLFTIKTQTAASRILTMNNNTNNPSFDCSGGVDITEGPGTLNYNKGTGNYELISTGDVFLTTNNEDFEDVIINKTAGAKVTLGTDLNTESLTILSGDFDALAQNPNIGTLGGSGNVSITTSGTVTGGSGTWDVRGSYIATTAAITHAAGTTITVLGEVSIDGTVTYTKGTGTFTLGDNGAVSDNIDFADNMIEDIVVSPNVAGTKRFTGNMDTESFLQTSGIIDINGQTWVVAGFFDIDPGSQWVGANMTGCAFTVGGAFTPVGADGNRINWNSPGAWTLIVNGPTPKTSNVDVANSDASGGNEICAADGTNIDSGGNTNWDFGAVAVAGSIRRSTPKIGIGIHI